MEPNVEPTSELKPIYKPDSNIPEAIVFRTKHGIESATHISDMSEKEGELSGVLCQGVQYYDLKNIPFIDNSGIASLIDLLKILLKQGITLKFVNANKNIKDKISSMGLDKFINCS